VVLSEEFGRTWYLAPSADVGADVVGSVALGAGPARVYGGVTEGEHCGCVLRFVVLVKVVDEDVVLATVMKSDNGKKDWDGNYLYQHEAGFCGWWIVQ
jgi:hypothetical protein